MKKLLLSFCGVVLLAGLSFAQDKGMAAEVSKKKDVTIFGVYTTYATPTEAVLHFDNRMVSIFNALKRFSVIGYQFRLDTASATKFIEKIKSLKKEKIMNDDKLIDEEFGVVTIPSAELRKMVNAFYVVIPTITGWKGKKIQKKVKYTKKGKVYYKKITVWTANISISIKIIDGEGTLLDLYNRSAKVESKKGQMDAYKKAVNKTIGGLTMWLRNQDSFKLKTKVLQANGGSLYLELGKDLGVKPGYEFVLQEKIPLGMTGKIIKKTTGLVRVKSIGDDYSEAAVIFGRPLKDMQLIEAPMNNLRTMIYAGARPAAYSLTNLVMTVGASSWSKDFTPSALTIEAGICAQTEIGYAGIATASVGVLINNPIGLYADLGGGYELQFGMFSIQPELALSVAWVGADMGTAYYNLTEGSVMINNIYIGGKVKLPINIQLSQSFKISIYADYAYYLPVVSSVTWSDPDASNSEDVSDYFSFAANGVSKTATELAAMYNLSGLGFGAQAMLRF